MKTYIDRALIIPALTDRYEPEDARYPMTLTLAHIAEALLGIPIADVTEVQHVRKMWKNKRNGMYSGRETVV